MSNSNLKPVRPCPVCGRDHDDDCRISTDGITVLCHTKGQGGTSRVACPPNEINGYRYIGMTADGRCGKYVPAPEQPTTWKKKPRVLGELNGLVNTEKSEYLYLHADEIPAVKVIRKDTSKGEKKITQIYYVPEWGRYENFSKQGKDWVSDLPEESKEELKASVPLYKLDRVLAAVAGVFLMEGEGKANALNQKLPSEWAATTLIGGAGKLHSYNADALKALLHLPLVILAPDADEKGIAHMEEIEAYLHTLKPELPIKWAYPLIPGVNWRNLPKSGGADLKDWLDLHPEATAEDVIRMAGAKMQAIQPIAQQKQQAKSESNLANEIRAVLAKRMKPSERKEAQIKIRTSFPGVSLQEFEDLWETISKEFEEPENRIEEVRKTVEEIISAKTSSIDISTTIGKHKGLCDALLEMAKIQNIRPEIYLALVMVGVGSSAKNGTILTVNAKMDFHVTPNIFFAMIAETGQKKSPVFKTNLKRPMQVLQKEAKLKYEFTLRDWQQRSKAAKEANKEFDEPMPERRIHFITKTTGEAILPQVNRVPDQGIVLISEELAGFFNSANQYKNGKGSDTQDLLEYYDGNGGSKLLTSGLRDDVDDVFNFGLAGAIQPDVLMQHMKGKGDPDGKWARFWFIHQPFSIAQMREEDHEAEVDESKSLSGILSFLYRRVNDFQPQNYKFSTEAWKVFYPYYNAFELGKIEIADKSLMAVYNKIAGRIAKFALILHLIEAAAISNRLPSREIQVSTLLRAIDLAEFSINQIKAVYAETEEDSLSAKYSKVLELCNRKNIVAARDVQMLFNSGSRPSAQEVRQWFVEMEELGYGFTEGEGKKITFSKTKSTKNSTPAKSTKESTTFKAVHKVLGDAIELDELSNGDAVQVFN